MHRQLPVLRGQPTKTGTLLATYISYLISGKYNKNLNLRNCIPVSVYTCCFYYCDYCH